MLLTLTIFVTFILMEGVAWAMHKYIMHGPFWHLHADHHDKRLMIFGFIERNDTFFLFFSAIAITAFALWSVFGWSVSLGIAVGVTLYGAVYFVIHDLFIHQRIKIWRNTKNPYLLAIRRAHKAHHKHLNKEDGECFGMLWVPLKYFKKKDKAHVVVSVD